IEWLCRAFGFAERLRAERDGMIGHAQLAVGEGAIMLGRQADRFARRTAETSRRTFTLWSMMWRVTSSVRSRTVLAFCNTRTTCHLASVNTPPWITQDTGGRSHRTSLMSRQRCGERSQPPIVEPTPNTRCSWRADG